MREEPPAQGLDGLLDTHTEILESASSLLPGGFRPLLEPAFERLLRLDARLVAQEPEHSEIGVDLPLHHPGEIEFDVRLTSEALVVPQDPKDVTVRDESPNVVLGAVQELLHESVRARPRRPGYPG